MAIKGSGTFLKFSEIAAEFGDSQPHSMSEFVRGGSLVPQADANNSIRAATDGPMRFAHFYGGVNVIAVTASSGTNVSAASLFGSNWTTDVPKELIIPSGVTLGATSTSNFALTIENNLAGTLTVKNSGSIQGAGGSVGANGGDAIDANASCIIINESTGQIYAGGGGGGTGGQGSITSWNNCGSQQRYPINGCYVGRIIGLSGSYPYNQCYYVGACSGTGVSRMYTVACPGGGGSDVRCQYPSTSYSSGGIGGVGEGYGQSATSGATGGTNAGTGGTGGSFGSVGNAGANGNYTNGVAGGSAGRYINGIANVTLTNNGAVAGGTV
jgi:hypothetical protein